MSYLPPSPVNLSLPSALPEDDWLNKLIFVDLETTGAALGYDRITEVGLCWHDPGQGWRSASTLVNPQIRIPDNISQLTSITNEMVAGAPVFNEISEELKSLLQGRVIVAHNVRFDYGFLSRELARCNLLLGQRHLCTVRLSRLLEPEYEKHNLATLVKRWSLSLDNHHRALDDALVLAQLWQSWAHRFGAATLGTHVNKAIREVHLPPKMDLQDLISLPDGPGVYFFYGEKRNLLYVGKSIDLRTRIFSHFSDALHNSKEARIIQATRHIETEQTAGELGALLRESYLIKTLQPIYNRRLRKKKQLHTWQLVADEEGYLYPQLLPFEQVPLNQLQHCYGLFKQPSDAKKALEGITRKHHVCKARTGLEPKHSPCFSYQLGHCHGACCGKEDSAHYNPRLKLALSSLAIAWWPFDGALAVKEHSEHNGLTQWHILHQWRYLGSYSEIPEHNTLMERSTEVPFDLDSYKILQQQLRKLSPSQIKVISIPALSRG